MEGEMEEEERGRKERGGERNTFDLEVLCHKTCYVYTAVSSLQEEGIIIIQPLLGEG